MSTPPVSDMDDSRDMPDTQPLREMLEHCQKHIYPVFHEADMAALKAQEQHRHLTRRVSWLGAGATILATFQLLAAAVLHPPRPGVENVSALAARMAAWSEHYEAIMVTLAVIELIVVAAMFGFILGGLRSGSKQKQLLERYRAERLRLLKFGFLLNPEVWSRDEKRIQRAQEEIHRKVNDIVTSMRPSLDRWISEGAVPSVWTAPEAELSGPELLSLVGYFRRKRVEFQMKYMSEAARRARERDEKSSVSVAVLFFGSVAFVLVHVAVEFVNGNLASELFVFIAAALPALITPLRIVRSAYESARNASRFEANYNTLDGLSERLSRAESGAAVFRELGFVEQTLEADHREWMRLMAEAEWFG